MRDLLAKIAEWLDSGLDVGLATVINTWGSAPRGVGAKMAFTLDGKIVGSVSGGCVEGAVYESGVEILSGAFPRLLHFGVADETAWDVGLACGGQIELFVEHIDPDIFNLTKAFYESDEIFATATFIKGTSSLLGNKLIIQKGGQLFGEISPGLDDRVAATVRSQIEKAKSGVKKITQVEGAAGPAELFIEVVQPTPTLVIVGGVHIAVALSSFAKNLGYKTIIVDPRRSFGSHDRFPHVDRLIQLWPQKAFQQIKLTPSTAVAILTHDPKIDDPAAVAALSSPAFYVGALGSRKTHASRAQRLLAAGVSKEQLSRLHGPIGLDIGANTPEEIALSIMAQIIELRAQSRDSY